MAGGESEFCSCDEKKSNSSVSVVENIRSRFRDAMKGGGSTPAPDPRRKAVATAGCNNNTAIGDMLGGNGIRVTLPRSFMGIEIAQEEDRE